MMHRIQRFGKAFHFSDTKEEQVQQPLDLGDADTLCTCVYTLFDLTKTPVDFALFKSIPLDLMLRYNFVPVHEKNGILWLAMADPMDVAAQDALRHQLKRKLKYALAPLAQIQEVLKKSDSSQKVMQEAGEALKVQVIHEENPSDEVLDLERISDKDEAPIIRMVDSAIFNALQRRASDIHMKTSQAGFEIKYRIDGCLYPASESIDKRFAAPIISRIKVMSELDIAEKRRPQDGRFKLKVRGRIIDFRVSIMPTVHGENAVIRILDKENLGEEFKSLSLDILGFSSYELKNIRRMAQEPYGMFLVTGPTGSGKTTTLYAVLTEIKTPEDNIITIEDPVEYQLEGVTQIPVNDKKGLSFAVGLRSILRHDPDKILVGEIRDSETAKIAIQSSLTGHLVFTTVHANNALDVIGRFQHMGVEVYTFVSALNCILAQRLVRTLCPKCKREIPVPDKEELLANGVDAKWAEGAQFFEKAGCLDCNGTGFRGRQAIVEFMSIDDQLREMIARHAPIRKIKEAAKKLGMQTLRESALEKVKQGVSTFAEINKVTFRE